MSSCEQMPGLNMLEHGEAVSKAYNNLLEKLKTEDESMDPFLQKMWNSFKNYLYPKEDLNRYQYWHDCGKHLCLSVDENGRRHFPNHAYFSSIQYKHIFPNDNLISTLIEMDMDFHLKRGDELKELWKSPHAPSLYLSAWAEIYANAEMFGGINSESFKIKRSRLIQAGKKSHFLTKE